MKPDPSNPDPAPRNPHGPTPLEANPQPQWTTPSFSPEPATPKQRTLKALGPSPKLMGILVFCLSVLLFLRSTQGEFVNYDDQDYVLENPMVNEGLSLESLQLAFTSSHSANWHPLTWLSHALDTQLYGLEPAGHHLTSVLLHGLVALLVLRLCLLLFDDRWLALAASLIWALHPLRVESVAWVSERKDVLSGVFGLLTLIAYVGWTFFPGRGRRIGVALCLLLGLMAKPMLVSLPLVMLALDAWPLRRLNAQNWKARCLEKWPYALIAFGVVLVTLYTQSLEGAVSSSDEINLVTRVENALLSVCIYLKQFLYPGTLSALYPHLANTSSQAQAELLWPALGCALILFALGLAAFFGRKRLPWLGLGLVWFGLMLLPVLGLVQVGYHAHADRYTYLPSIGLAILGGALFRLARERAPRAALGVLILGLGLMSLKTWRQIGLWQNSIRLWEHALTRDPVNLVAHKSLAQALWVAGDTQGALQHYGLAQQMDPRDAVLLNHIGELQIELGNWEAASVAFAQAMQVEPNDWTYALNSGIASEQLGQASRAETALEAAARLGCADYRLPLTRARIARAKDDIQGAKTQLQAALERSTTAQEEIRCFEWLGALQVGLQELEAALASYRRVVELDAADSLGHYNLGNVLELNGQPAEAAQAFARALALDPAFELAAARLARLRAGR